MKAIKGWCCLTDTISGWELVWRTEDVERNVIPEVYTSEEEVRYAIAEDVMDDTRQYLAGEREWDEIHQFNEYLPAEIEIDEEGNIQVYQIGESINGPTIDVLIRDTIDNWCKNL